MQTDKNTAEYWIKKLGLLPHPEGGFYKEVYRSSEVMNKNSLPDRYSGDRSFSTSIYYLLTSDQVSKLHRIQSDEIWHHYAGSDLELFVISNQQELEKYLLGKQSEVSAPQVVIPKGCWFGAHCSDASSYSLVGCTVSPGFDFEDFELCRKDNLAPEIKNFQKQIDRLI